MNPCRNLVLVHNCQKILLSLQWKVKHHPMRSRFVAWIGIDYESTRMLVHCLRSLVAGKHTAKRFVRWRVLFQSVRYLSSVHLTRVIVNNVSFCINLDQVFKFPIIDETHCRSPCGRELEVKCYISSLNHVKMRRGSTHIGGQIESINGIILWKIFSRNVVSRLVIPFSRAGKQRAVRFNIYLGFAP